MKKWVIQFRRALIWATATNDNARKALLVWKAPGAAGQMGRVRYWNGGSWTISYDKAKTYKNFEQTEARAFKLALKEPSLIGELEVVEYVPVSRPKR